MDTVAKQVRDILKAHAQLPVDVSSLDENADLYAAGMKSFAVVQVMLALEAAYDIEFPEQLLVRRTFASIAGIISAVDELTRSKALST